jgi:hypothetical protein
MPFLKTSSVYASRVKKIGIELVWKDISEFAPRVKRKMVRGTTKWLL